MSQATCHLAILYLQDRKGYPTQYRHDLMDGRMQGVAFLNSMHNKEREALPWKKSQELKQISTTEALEDFINWLLDYQAKENQK